MRNMNVINTNVSIPSGGVHFETRRNLYRGSVTVNSVRYRTSYFATRTAAMRALNQLRKDLAKNLVASKRTSTRSSSVRSSR